MHFCLNSARCTTLHPKQGGYLDEISVADVSAYEKQLLSFVRANAKEVLDALGAANELTSEVEEKITKLLDNFKTVFHAGK